LSTSHHDTPLLLSSSSCLSWDTAGGTGGGGVLAVAGGGGIDNIVHMNRESGIVKADSKPSVNRNGILNNDF
jgi:hypothetical protein